MKHCCKSCISVPWHSWSCHDWKKNKSECKLKLFTFDIPMVISTRIGYLIGMWKNKGIDLNFTSNY